MAFLARHIKQVFFDGNSRSASRRIENTVTGFLNSIHWNYDVGTLELEFPVSHGLEVESYLSLQLSAA